MKKIIYYFLISSLFACNDLDLNPLAQGSSESWFENETELEMSVRGLYNMGYWTLDSDEHTDDWTNRTVLSVVNAATINGQSSVVTTLWNNSYQAIARANTILDNLDKAQQNGISQKIIDQSKAEALFARAVQYSRLVSHFGDVVYVTSSIRTLDEAFKMGRTDKAEVIKGIYADFDAAADQLPLNYSGEERATKGAAYSFKARFALYNGDYNVAAEAAKKCMDLEVYDLHPEFSELFLSGTKETDEFIFVRPRSVELNLTIGTQVYLTRNPGGYSQYDPSWDLFCAFLCTDGKPIDESPLYDPQNPFKNRDPRCTATIVEFGTQHVGFIYEPHPDSLYVMNFNTGVRELNKDTRTNGQYASYNGIVWKKGVDDTYTKNGYKADKNEIIMRYADVLLMYAEAKIEAGSVDQSVLDAMNRVRARAYGVKREDTDSYPAITTQDKNELRKMIRFERRMEFAFEGLRYMDLIRWRIAEKALNTRMYGMLDPEPLIENVVKRGLWFFPGVPDIDENGIADFSEMASTGLIKLLAERKFDATKQYLWPIPTKEILINENLKQNPGY
ncbi:MAG: RagB/SusD family nutrient uptake outer membrane protein [Tannerella sp.]|jgi:hypothetical protein|nr:RagB/SusD family nutrient uptake outer membrane protein [Tannerella sp.]